MSNAAWEPDPYLGSQHFVHLERRHVVGAEYDFRVVLKVRGRTLEVATERGDRLAACNAYWAAVKVAAFFTKDGIP